MKVAVVGATGMVGRVMTKLLMERGFPVTEFIPVASERSVGNTIEFQGLPVKVVSMEDAIAKKPNLALFSAGGDTSKNWAPKFAEVGCTVVDNSSAWRMSPEHKLIVPEINAHELTASDKIIANPNCSTIQMLMALAPLHKSYWIKRIVISTYQSITGTGKAAVTQMENERTGVKGEMVYPYNIDKNCLPHCDVFMENDYTREEMKLVKETHKILQENEIGVSATAVRVPVVGGHSESINVTFHKEFLMSDVRKLLNDAPRVVLQDNPAMNIYPMPAMAEGKDDVFVGRLRLDNTMPNTLNMWVVADNLRKGAATNAIQIAEYLLDKKML